MVHGWPNMIEFGVAVATDATYTVKRIDNDFFESI
jgi:restriction endonuclease Mrr